MAKGAFVIDDLKNPHFSQVELFLLKTLSILDGLVDFSNLRKTFEKNRKKPRTVKLLPYSSLSQTTYVAKLNRVSLLIQDFCTKIVHNYVLTRPIY